VYADLIALRKEHLRLFVDGALNWLQTDDATGVVAYERVLGDQRAIVAFNTSTRPQTMTVPAGNGTYRMVFPRTGTVEVTEGSLTARLGPKSAVIWIRT
jgi:glycosidase